MKAFISGGNFHFFIFYMYRKSEKFCVFGVSVFLVFFLVEKNYAYFSDTERNFLGFSQNFFG